MSDLPAASMAWLATHHGAITTTVLREHGVGRATITRLVSRGVLEHAAKRVLVITAAKRTFEQRCAVLALAHPNGFLTGPTAGTLGGLRRMPTSAPLHIAVRHGRHHRPVAGVVWRQTCVIWNEDREERDGITVASWPRLAFDLASDLSRLDHLSVVNQLLQEQKLTVDDLVAIDRRLGHPARAGSGRFRQTLEAIEGSRPNDSHPEVVLADALRARGVPVEHQVSVVRSTDGVGYHIDLAVPSVRWGIEVDVHPEHRSVEGHAADADRRRALHRMSWQLEVVTEHDMRRPDHIADELAGIYRVRAAACHLPSAS